VSLPVGKPHRNPQRAGGKTGYSVGKYSPPRRYLPISTFTYYFTRVINICNWFIARKSMFSQLLIFYLLLYQRFNG
jgi:hypothetical protein